MISAWEPSHHHLHKTTVSTRVFWLFHGLNTSPSRALFSLSSFLFFFSPFLLLLFLEKKKKHVCCRACSIACLHTRSRGAAHLLFWRSPLKYNHCHQQPVDDDERAEIPIRTVCNCNNKRMTSFLKCTFLSRRDISILTVQPLTLAIHSL